MGEAGKSMRQAARLAPRDRKAAILAAARRVLAETGYENFLPSDVAKRCGVSEATIYRYFPTKRDLLIQVAEDWFEEILQLEPEATTGGDTFSQLRQVVWYSLSIVRQAPALTRFVLLVLRSDVDYGSRRIYELNRRFTDVVTRVVEQAIASGVFRSDVSPTLIRDMIFGAVEHRTWAYLRGGDFSIEDAADGIAGIIFRGMAASDLKAPSAEEWGVEIDRLATAAEELRLGLLALRSRLP